MPVGAVGDPAADQDAAHRAEHVKGQGCRRRLQGQPARLVQHGDEPGLDACPGHRRHHKEGKKRQDRAREQKPRILAQAGLGLLPRAAVVDQDAALPDNRQHHRHADQPYEQKRIAPADQTNQRRGHRRRRGKADMPDKGVDRKRAADPARIDRAAENRVIGRVDDRVPEPRQHRQERDLPVGGREPHAGDRQGHQACAEDQKAARAVAVDEKPDRRLHDSGGTRHQGHREAELGIGHTKGLLPHDEHRRQAQLVIMRQEMAAADQRVDPRVAAKFWQTQHRSRRFRLRRSTSPTV